MAKTSGQRGLNFSGQFDIEDIRKKQKEVIQGFADLKKSAEQSVRNGGSSMFDKKPLTTYQAELLRIKQETLDFAKEKQIQAQADKTASLATQQALREEAKLRREATLAAKEQAKAAASVKRPVDIGNTNQEIQNYYNSMGGNGGKTSTAFTEYLRLVKKDFDAGKISAAEYVTELDRYSDAVVNSANNSKKLVTETKTLSLSKKELAQDLAIEKLRYQENAAALKVNAREMANAKGSIEQRRAALIRLNATYDRLSALERASPAGQRLKGIVTGLTEQVKTLEAETGRAQRNVGNYTSAFAKGANRVWSGLKTIANILPGVGLAGLLAFAIDPIYDYIKGLDLFKSKASEAKLAQEGIAKALATSEYTNAVKNVNELRINIDLARQGFLSKEGVLKQYNETIGKTTGEVTSLDKAEQELNKNADNFIKVTLLKAAAQIALESAAKSAYEAEISRRKKLEEFGNTFLDASVSNVRSEEQYRSQQANIIANRKKRQEDEVKISEDAAKEQINIAKKFQEDAAKISKSSSFVNFLGNDDKTNKSANNERQRTLEELKKYYTDVNEIEMSARDKELSNAEQTYEKLRLSAKKSKLDLIELDLSYQKAKDAINSKYDKIDNKKNYEAETQRQSTEIERQKKLFSDFESYKTQFGKSEAIKRFGDQTNLNKALIDQLTKDNKEFIAKSLKGGLSEEEKKRFEVVAKALGQEKDLKQKSLDDAKKLAQTHNDELILIEQKYNDALIQLGVNATEEQKQVLYKGKQDEIDSLNQKAFQQTEIYKKLSVDIVEITKEQVKSQIKALERILEAGGISEELANRIKDNISDLKFTLKLGVDEGYINAVKERISDITETLRKSDAGEKILSKEDYTTLYNRLVELGLIIEKVTNPDGSKKSNFAKGLEENFAYLKGNTQQVAEGLSNDLGRISGSFGELSNALGGVNTEAGYTLDTIGQLVGVASDAAGAVSSFASGDIIGGITKTIKAVTGLFNIGKKVREMNAAARKEVEDFYRIAQEGERKYLEALRERELQNIRNNKTVLQGVKDEIALRNTIKSDSETEFNNILKQLQGMQYVADTVYKHGTWFRKATTTNIMAGLSGMSFEDISKLYSEGRFEGEANKNTKALVERLIELEKQGFDTSKALEELDEQYRALFTGTTADAISDAIINGFKDGKRTIEDFADDFKSLMSNAVLSIFRNDVLAPKIDEFYKQFADRAIDGIISEEDEAFLKERYSAILSESESFIESYNKIIGKQKGIIPDPNAESLKALQDDISSIFDSGAVDAKTLGLKLEEIIKRSILDGFKAEIFKEGLKKFNDELVKIQDSGKTITKAQIEELKLLFGDFSEDALARLKIIEEATGYTFSNVAKELDSAYTSLEDSIINIFSTSENSAEDFAKSFEDLMKNAILNSFKATTLRDQLTGFYEEFKKLSTGADGLTEEKIAILRARYNEIINNSRNTLNDIEKVTGIDLTAKPTQSNLASNISRSITEDTASELAGLWRGQFNESKIQTSIMNRNAAISNQILEVNINIEKNTRRTADNTERLSAMEIALNQIASNTNGSVTQGRRDSGNQLPVTTI